MVQNLSREIAQCYQQADDCRVRAERANDPQQRQLLLDTERRWLHLARSHEMRQRVTAFAQDGATLHVLTPLHPAIPRVMCPDCGKNMRLERIEPTVSPRRGDNVTFRCECARELQQTINRVD